MKPETLRTELQKMCSAWGAYWRGPDAHGVELTTEQAVELLRNALNVEVEINDEEVVTQPKPEQAAQPTYTEDEIADAAMLAEIPDSKLESLLIVLAASPKPKD